MMLLKMSGSKRLLVLRSLNTKPKAGIRKKLSLLRTSQKILQEEENLNPTRWAVSSKKKVTWQLSKNYSESTRMPTELLLTSQQIWLTLLPGILSITILNPCPLQWLRMAKEVWFIPLIIKR